MSIFDERKETFEVMTKTSVPDGTGSSTDTYTASGTEFVGVLSESEASAKEVGEASRAPQRFKITTDKTVVLSFGQVIRRKACPIPLFKVVDKVEKQTPPSASLNMRRHHVEEIV